MIPNSLLVGLTVLVTVSLWLVLVAVLDSLLARPINVLVTVSPWTVLLKLLFDCLSLDCPVECADDYLSLNGPVEVASAVEVNTLDLSPVISADTVAW